MSKLDAAVIREHATGNLSYHQRVDYYLGFAAAWKSFDRDLFIFKYPGHVAYNEPGAIHYEPDAARFQDFMGRTERVFERIPLIIDLRKLDFGKLEEAALQHPNTQVAEAKADMTKYEGFGGGVSKIVNFPDYNRKREKLVGATEYLEWKRQKSEELIDKLREAFRDAYLMRWYAPFLPQVHSAFGFLIGDRHLLQLTASIEQGPVSTASIFGEIFDPKVVEHNVHLTGESSSIKNWPEAMLANFMAPVGVICLANTLAGTERIYEIRKAG